jgi:hypothetical protein
MASPTAQERSTGMSESGKRQDGHCEQGLFCDLGALDEAQRKRRALLEAWLQEGTVEIDELPDGYRFHLDPASLAARHVDEFIALEKLCCPFLRSDLRTDSGHPGIALELGGGHEVKAFVAAQFGVRGAGSSMPSK